MQKQTFATVATPGARGDEPEITISTIALDRADDEVDPDGAEFTSYKRNPVVLFGHDYSSLPVGSTTQLDVVAGRGIRARWRWLDGDPFADRVRNAWDAGVLRAASIGFMPKASEPNGRGGRRFTRWELLEWSLCAVPANPEAVRVLRSLDLWRSADAVLELEDDAPPEQLEVDAADVYAAIAATLPTALREALPGLVAEQVRDVFRARAGRIGEPLGDPAARHRSSAPGTSEEREVVELIRATIGGELRAVIARETAAALRRATGRID